MLTNDIVLDKKDGTDVTYRLVSSSPDGSRRLDVGSTLALPGTLTIKHSTTGKAPTIVDRHLIQVNRTVTASIGVASCNVNLTITVPRDSAITNTVVYDVLSNLIDFLLDGSSTGLATTANVDSILRGES